MIKMIKTTVVLLMAMATMVDVTQAATGLIVTGMQTGSKWGAMATMSGVSPNLITSKCDNQ